MSRCHHADSGCNFPEGECLGVCMSGVNHTHYVHVPARVPAKPSHTARRVATVLGFMCIGIVACIYMHDYTIAIERENDALRALNMQMLRDRDAEQHCTPRSEHSKAIMQRVNGDLRCEIHTKGV